MHEFQKLQAKADPANDKPGGRNNTYGCKGKPEEENQVDNINEIGQGRAKGTSREYLTRVMARDCPEILDQIGRDKKYRSGRAAAIDRGIIKPRLNVSWNEGG